MKYRPTSNILEMANTLEHFAQKLRKKAIALEDTGDLGYAVEAVNTISNLFRNLDMSTLVTNTLREQADKKGEIK